MARKLSLGLVVLVAAVVGVGLWQVYGNMGGMMGSGMMGRTTGSGQGTPAAPARYRAGEGVFRTNCSSCHPGGRNAVQPDHPIIGATQLSDFNTFNQFIRNPREPGGSPGPMPPFPASKISDRQSRQLYDYIVNVLQKHQGSPPPKPLR